MALVLSRKEGQGIVIDELTVVRITRISGSRVKVVIEAPRGIAVIREELVERDNENGVPVVGDGP